MSDFQQVTDGVCGRVQVLGNEPVFVDLGINGTYCHDVLLTGQLLPVMREISSQLFIFRRDSARAH